MEDLVWAFKPLKELNGETGFVNCDSELAKKLIAAGKAQDPRDGAHWLKEIEADTPTYETKVMTPEEPKKRGRPRKSDSDVDATQDEAEEE